MQIVHNPRNDKYDHLFKLLFIGDSGVGKSSLMLRFADDSFTESYISTIGVDFKIKTVDIGGKIVKLQLWDTAGQEKFRTITSAYYRGAHGVVIAYDTTDYSSFEHIVRWMSDVDKECSSKVARILVGCKADLVDRRTVEYKQGQMIASELGMAFIETSAKESANIHEAFELFATTLLDNQVSMSVSHSQNGGANGFSGSSIVPGQESARPCCFT